MRLREPEKLLEIWNHAFEQGASVVLMRHAPKSGSNESDLSDEGERLATEYGKVLGRLGGGYFGDPLLCYTSKSRTTQTLELLFPRLGGSNFYKEADLEVNRVTQFVQQQCNELHARIGHLRGYFLNHTYYFLEQLGGRFDEENVHTVVAQRMVEGIEKLFRVGRIYSSVIYCGHSPSIEVACQRLLNMSLAELGGFLNPLDSIHLRIMYDKIEFVARTHVIVDYADLESETYYGKETPE